MARLVFMHLTFFTDSNVFSTLISPLILKVSVWSDPNNIRHLTTNVSHMSNDVSLLLSLLLLKGSPYVVSFRFTSSPPPIFSTSRNNSAKKKSTGKTRKNMTVWNRTHISLLSYLAATARPKPTHSPNPDAPPTAARQQHPHPLRLSPSYPSPLNRSIWCPPAW